MRPHENISGKLPWFTFILHPVKEYYLRCSKGTQRNIVILSQVLMFTVFTCGAIFAASLCKFCFNENYKLFVPLFLITGVFYYLIDKPIVFSDLKQYQRIVRIVRIFLAIVLGLFNSFLIDSYWFEADINAARKEEIATRSNEITAKYAKDLKAMNDKKITLLTSIDKLQMSLKSKRDACDAEADGTGGTGHVGPKEIWRVKMNSYKADSIGIAQTIKMKNDEISIINSSIDKTNGAMSKEIAEIPAQVSTGVNKSMELLHQTIWLKGNFTNIFVSILILLVAMFFELVPLFSKSFYDVSEYFQKSYDELEESTDESKLRKVTNMKLNGIKSVHRLNREQQGLFLEAGINRMRDDLEQNKIIIEETEAHLVYLEKSEQRLKLKFPMFYESYILPVFKKLYLNLKLATEKAFINN